MPTHDILSRLPLIMQCSDTHDCSLVYRSKYGVPTHNCSRFVEWSIIMFLSSVFPLVNERHAETNPTEYFIAYCLLTLDIKRNKNKPTKYHRAIKYEVL